MLLLQPGTASVPSATVGTKVLGCVMKAEAIAKFLEGGFKLVTDQWWIWLPTKLRMTPLLTGLRPRTVRVRSVDPE